MCFLEPNIHVWEEQAIKGEIKWLLKPKDLHTVVSKKKEKKKRYRRRKRQQLSQKKRKREFLMKIILKERKLEKWTSYCKI